MLLLLHVFMNFCEVRKIAEYYGKNKETNSVYFTAGLFSKFTQVSPVTLAEQTFHTGLHQLES